MITTDIRRLLDVVGGFDERVAQKLAARFDEQDTLLRVAVERLHKLTGTFTVAVPASMVREAASYIEKRIAP